MSVTSGVSKVIEYPVVEVERILSAPFALNPLTFLIGLIVIQFVLELCLYGSVAIAECRESSNSFCKNTFTRLDQIVSYGISVFAFLFYIRLISGGIRAHGLTVKAFLPFASFAVFIHLLIWLLKDILPLMKDDVGDGKFLSYVQYGIYHIFNQFDIFSYGSDNIANNEFSALMFMLVPAIGVLLGTFGKL